MGCCRLVKVKPKREWGSVVRKCKAFEDEWEEGFQEGFQKGSKLIGELIRCMIRDNRADELGRIVSDSEYQEMVLREYGLM